MRPALQMTLTPPLLRKNLAVAVVVGTILNVINQGDALFLVEEIDIVKLALTYCVPFFVASYGSYNSLRSLEQAADGRTAAVAD